jgi:hypothetical protein
VTISCCEAFEKILEEALVMDSGLVGGVCDVVCESVGGVGVFDGGCIRWGCNCDVVHSLEFSARGDEAEQGEVQA